MKLVNKKIYLFIVVILAVFFISNNSSAAGFIKEEVKNKIGSQSYRAGLTGGYQAMDQNDIYALVQTVINGFLALIGVLLLAYLLYAGYKWMTAHGEEEKVTQAKDSIRHAIIGVIIIVAAYAISVFVMSRLEAGTLKPATQASLTDQAGEDSNSGINWRAADVIGKQN